MEKITIEKYRQLGGTFEDLWKYVRTLQKKDIDYIFTPKVKDVYKYKSQRVSMELLEWEDKSETQARLLQIVKENQDVFGDVIFGHASTFIHKDTIQFGLNFEIIQKFKLRWSKEDQETYKTKVKKLFKDKYNIDLRDVAVWSTSIRIGIK